MEIPLALSRQRTFSLGLDCFGQKSRPDCMMNLDFTLQALKHSIEAHTRRW